MPNKHDTSNRDSWEYSNESYGSITKKDTTKHEPLAKRYLDAILQDLSAVIKHLETKESQLKNKDMGKYYSATE